MARKIAVFSILAMFHALLGVPAQAEDQSVYNKYNIHTQMKGPNLYKASYANYTNPGGGHVIFPAGTLMSVDDTDSDAITFLLQDGRKIHFEFHETRMGMSVEKYLDLITSAEPVPLDKFSELDREGIKAGKALIGMTKTGVLTALGYPAAHRTPSLDSGSWVYWTNRFGTIRIDFDERGKVAKIVD